MPSTTAITGLVDGTTGATPLTDTTSTPIIAATAGRVTVLTALAITNGHATVDTLVQLLDGSTVKWAGFMKSAGGGVAISGIEIKGSTNSAWNAKCVTTGSSVSVNLCGYQT